MTEHEKLTRVFTTDGLLDLPITDKEDASTIGQYWNAIKEYLFTGESWKLEAFEDVSIQVGEKRFKLNTKLDEVEELYDVGELNFDDIYEFIY